jgi:hypothetical protein
MDYPSVEQGCLQVLSTRVLLQTPLHLLLPSMMFVTVLVLHRFFGNADLSEQVATREHPAYLKSCLRLSRLVSICREDRLGVSASEGACAYSCHLAVHTIYDIFDSGFMTLEVCCLPQSSALPITPDTGSSCDGVDHPAAAVRPCVLGSTVSSRKLWDC